MRGVVEVVDGLDGVWGRLLYSLVLKFRSGPRVCVRRMIESRSCDAVLPRTLE